MSHAPVMTSHLILSDGGGMNLYKRPRFPPDIMSYAVWLYHRFNLSHRGIEELLVEWGITVSYESIRLWGIKFGPEFAKRRRRKHWGFGDTSSYHHHRIKSGDLSLPLSYPAAPMD